MKQFYKFKKVKQNNEDILNELKKIEYADVKDIDGAIEFIFDNDCKYIIITGYYDEEFSIKDAFDYYGINKQYYSATTSFFEDDEDEVGLTETVIKLREIRKVLDKDQIKNIVNYLSFGNLKHLEFKL